MKNLLQHIIKLFLFWLLFFALQALLFILYNYTELHDVGYSEIVLSFLYGLRLNISASAYLMSLPALLLIAALFIRKNKLLISMLNISNAVLLICCILICTADIGLYSIWGSKINGKAIAYLAYPATAIKACAAVPYWLFIVVMGVEIFLLLYIYKCFVKLHVVSVRSIWFKIVFPFVFLFLLLTGIRGGWQLFPINKSCAYYSNNNTLNNAAVNGFWNFMEVLLKPDITKNPYHYFDDATAKAITASIYTPASDSTEFLLNTHRPNIVLILMESVSATCMQRLGGTESIMPRLDCLANESLLFTQFYSTGFRTEQGLVALFSSFPAQPQSTIMRKFGKFDQLPNLVKTLHTNGYNSNYYYSGDLVFANQFAYLKLAGFKNIYDENSYPWKHRTEWGSYDEELFSFYLKQAKNDHTPFFSVIMTSTSHETFDANVPNIFEVKGEADKYKNTVHYTDQCIANFLKQAESAPWYKNTIFIITSDHAHRYPNGYNANAFERHHIPLLLFGPALKAQYKGKTISRLGSHTDFAATLLAQLQIASSDFKQSNNLMNPGIQEFAFYTFDNGFGCITPKQGVVYDHHLNKLVERKNPANTATDSIATTLGKARLQSMFKQYIEFNN